MTSTRLWVAAISWSHRSGSGASGDAEHSSPLSTTVREQQGAKTKIISHQQFASIPFVTLRKYSYKQMLLGPGSISCPVIVL